MYKETAKGQMELDHFHMSFGGQLDKKNRWIQLSELIPWDELEDDYANHFNRENGNPAKSFRMALGSLIIQTKLNLTDRETVRQISENPYMQYLVGLQGFINEEPFDPSLMVHFRKRITPEVLEEINERIHREQVKKNEKRKRRLRREDVLA